MSNTVIVLALFATWYLEQKEDHPILWQELNSQPINSTTKKVTNFSESLFDMFLSTLSRWDGLYFIDIAKNGYKNLKDHAFFPGYP